MDHMDHSLFLAVFCGYYVNQCMDHPGAEWWKESSEKSRMTIKPPSRTRLPNRRPLITESLFVGGQTIEASVGFDAAGRPRELFLTGAKDGTDLAAILDDASVVLSVAGAARAPASVIGAALDLVQQLEPSGGDYAAA